MKSLQRLQQHILATDVGFGIGVHLTPRAERLRTAFKRTAVVGISAVTLLGAAAYVKTGPGSYDPQKLYTGDARDTRVMASLYDRHRALLSAREHVLEIKRDMISGEGVESLETQAVALRQAEKIEKQLAQQFDTQSKGITEKELHRIIDDDDMPVEESGTLVAQNTSRVKP